MPTKYKGSEEDQRALDAYICLQRAADSVVVSLNRKSDIGGITPSQFSILECLYHSGPLKPGQLAQKMLMSCGNITYVLDKLVLKKLVTRVPNPNDRRSFVIDLHRSGKSLVEKNLPKYVSNVTEIFSCLSKREQQQLKNLTKKLGLAAKKAQT